MGSKTHSDQGHADGASERSSVTDHSAASILDGLTPHELGTLGEMLAACYLEERGYDVLEHGYRCPEGEADLIAFDNATEEIVLVEVKARRMKHANELYPEEAVDGRKRKRYRRIASCYIMDRFPVMSVRFDVIGVCVISGEAAQVDHIIGAFDWELSQ